MTEIQAAAALLGVVVIVGTVAMVAAVYAGIAAGVAQEQDRVREASDV